MSNKEYKVVNGTYYDINTNNEVIEVLESARIHNKRIRVFYGDISNGTDWNEENDIVGSVNRSSGINKIPLLIKNKNSIGGGGILDNCIVKITIDKKIIYQDKNYKNGSFEVVKSEDNNLINKGYLFSVLKDGNVFANFKNELKANNYVNFIVGISNKK